ncbi:hypothetical protein EV379_0889 [Microterricola gilva]|uniref:FtsX-like permease family protein n=1 Tax=Microterricola gilva TaxID=393267 RepID=A0A4Q8AJP3_9MICO|nr:hypothetical protein EV379_0889 [Microterricola gilva]
MPSALRRFLRAPARVAAVGLLALTMLAASLVQGAAAAALRHGVDASSRPLYDILVTAADAGAARPTVFPPGALSSAVSALTQDDVAAIRALDGVEVAAPIGHIVLPNLWSSQLRLRAPLDPAQLTPAAESYRATVRLITDDGLGERLVSERIYNLALDRSTAPTALPPEPDEANSTDMCPIGPVAVPCSLFGWNSGSSRAVAWLENKDFTGGFGYQEGGDVWVSLPDPVFIDQSVTLIDPVAEAALLGGAAAFLEPLRELGGERSRSVQELERWAAASATPTQRVIRQMVEDIASSREQMRSTPAYAEYARLMVEQGLTPRDEDLAGPEATYIPLLVADAPEHAPLRAELTLEGFGPLGDFAGRSDQDFYAPTFPDALRSGAPGTPLGTVSQDAGVLLDAFAPGTVDLLWPGSPEPEPLEPAWAQARTIQLGDALVVAPSTPSAVQLQPDGSRTARLDGRGFRSTLDVAGSDSSAQAGASLDSDPTVLGVESVFSTPRRAERGVAEPAEYHAGIAVGRFTAADLDGVAELAAGIPLGAYDSPAAVLVQDADGAKRAPTAITPALGGFGLLGAETTAFGDIRSPVWRESPAVDAVRVRAAGVSDYDPRGIASVVALARSIEDAGYTATVVAGSHADTVRVTVDDYAFGTMDAAAGQRVGELGVVEQRWTVLGPAAGLTSAVGTGMLLLLNTVLLAVLGLLALTEFGAIPARRRDAATLRELGWRRSRIAGWFAGEQLVGLLLVAGVCAIALAAAPAPAVAAPVVAAGVVGAALICVTATVRATRPREAGTVSAETLERSFGVEYRPEARVVGGALHGNDAGDRGAASAPRAQRRLPGSAVSWGIQRAWRRPAAALPMAIAVLTAMATVAAFALAMTEITGHNAQAQMGAQLAAVAPQLLLALCGAGVAAVLIVRSRAQSAREGRELRAVLEATGWPNEERRRAALSASLAVTLASVLLGSYLLWFALGALGVASENTIVSSALAAGIAVAVLLLVPLPAWRGASRFTRKAVVPDGDAA